MSSHAPRRALWLALLALAPLTSCLVGSQTKTEYKGRYVSAETLALVEPGATREFVLDLLGQPSTRTTLDDDSEVWKWTYEEEKTKRGSVLFVVSSSKTERTQGAVYVQLRGGLVTKTWRD